VAGYGKSLSSGSGKRGGAQVRGCEEKMVKKRKGRGELLPSLKERKEQRPGGGVKKVQEKQNRNNVSGGAKKKSTAFKEPRGRRPHGEKVPGTKERQTKDRADGGWHRPRNQGGKRVSVRGRLGKSRSGTLFHKNGAGVS